jgi:hypothetical protein
LRMRHRESERLREAFADLPVQHFPTAG